jgi:uncharacterized protein (TIGR02284 family)
MSNTEETIETLNDLVRINHDRVDGYEKAAHQLEASDVDLKAMFMKMASDSKSYADELTNKITSLGGDSTSDTTVKGKIYRTWMDVKNVFTGSDRTSILESCEFGEDAAQRAYNEALDNDDLDVNTRQIIMDQKDKLKTAHDTVKRYRDMHKSIS